MDEPPSTNGSSDGHADSTLGKYENEGSDEDDENVQRDLPNGATGSERNRTFALDYQ